MLSARRTVVLLEARREMHGEMSRDVNRQRDSLEMRLRPSQSLRGRAMLAEFKAHGNVKEK